VWIEAGEQPTLWPHCSLSGNYSYSATMHGRGSVLDDEGRFHAAIARDQAALLKKQDPRSTDHAHQVSEERECVRERLHTGACVCVCVREREGERERGRQRGTHHPFSPGKATHECHRRLPIADAAADVDAANAITPPPNHHTPHAPSHTPKSQHRSAEWSRNVRMGDLAAVRFLT
jgi:hypothetical protein